MTNLRSWLRKQPQPVRVMLDNDPKRTIEVPQGRGKWVDLIATLGAVEFETIACLGPDGGILRATSYSADGGDVAEEKEETYETTDPIAALVQCVCNLTETMRQMANEASERANKAEEAYSKAVVARAQAEATAAIALNTPQQEGQSDLQTIASTFLGGVQRGRSAPNGGTNGTPTG